MGEMMSVDDAIGLTPEGQGGGRLFQHDGRMGFESGDGMFEDPTQVTAILLWFDIRNQLEVIRSSTERPK